jgi:hypothetical protein
VPRNEVRRSVHSIADVGLVGPRRAAGEVLDRSKGEASGAPGFGCNGAATFGTFCWKIIATVPSGG